jgi:DNA-binding transcriptional MerR regulator
MENTTPTIVPPAGNKFTAEEIKEIAEIRDGFDKATVTFGKLYLQKREMEKVEKQLTEELSQLEKEEKTFLDKIVAKYGEGSYDPTTGIFTPNKK